ncbi:M57 family metalloprotease [Nocardioides donggukensis]|uniref:Peptidase M16 n=1 Tax=Nocardioides donggukensis TaxID=2774019 RepID=A0A927K467_9ACTN|nr:M57 family metalloprotease [Nocardioides donggukensis]MBD8870357.1 peptidase M16 [Nocardioides donggukensis]
MKRTRLCQAAVATTGLIAAGLAATTAGSAQGAESDVPTFQEYAASAFQDADKQYVVNGDEPIMSKGGLRDFYDRMTGDKHTGRQVEDGLVVNTVSGKDDKWSASQVGSLTYCVSTKFGSDQAAVVAAMSQGAALWENASSAIDFTHVTSADSKCTVRNRSVVFSVEPTNTTQYIARAFFPSSPDRSRNILVNAGSLQSSGSWTPGNIMGHELGHTLGFRHEHTRPESGTCFEDNNWRPLTPYDSASIMHYPQCNGTSNDLSFTSSDAAGARNLYGS